MVLVLLTFGFIFYKLVYAYHINKLVNEFQFTWGPGKIVILVSVVLLMILNWSLEAAKWRLLINKNETISFSDSVKAIVSGIALSIITPNQIGDFAGRIIHLKTFNKLKGTLVTVIGHTAQVIMTIAAGLMSLIWFMHEQGKITDQISLMLNLVSVFLIFISFWAFLNIDIISRLTKSEKIKPYLDVFAFYNSMELTLVLFIASLRYTVFVIQYLLLLHFFDVHLQFYQTVNCIIATLFAQSFVPSFLLIEIGMRGASALFFFTNFTDNSAGILLSAYSLWIINLMLPSMYGLWVILKMRITK